MKDFLQDKMKYIREPWRLRVHLAYLLVILLALLAWTPPYLFEIGAVMVLLGIFIRAWASGIVKKDEQLAVTGPYSLVRNPLYVGNFLIGYGFCFIQGQFWSFALLTIYFGGIYPFTIEKEEKKLARYFPESYEEYAREVPRLIPRLSPYRTLRGWDPNQYFVNNKDWLNEGFVLLFFAYTLYLYLT